MTEERMMRKMEKKRGKNQLSNMHTFFFLFKDLIKLLQKFAQLVKLDSCSPRSISERELEGVFCRVIKETELYPVTDPITRARVDEQTADDPWALRLSV